MFLKQPLFLYIKDLIYVNSSKNLVNIYPIFYPYPGVENETLPVPTEDLNPLGTLQDTCDSDTFFFFIFFQIKYVIVEKNENYPVKSQRYT